MASIVSHIVCYLLGAVAGVVIMCLLRGGDDKWVDFIKSDELELKFEREQEE